MSGGDSTFDERHDLDLVSRSHIRAHSPRGVRRKRVWLSAMRAHRTSSQVENDLFQSDNAENMKA